MSSRNASTFNPRCGKGRTCLCSPTTHPGSFRCSLHRNFSKPRAAGTEMVRVQLAKVNSIKAFLLQIITPSCHDLQRRRNFQPKPSRFCLLNGHHTNSFGLAVS